MSVPPLSLLQSRLLGVLVEKQRAVPDTYPLSLNALVAGCNQKSSRDPVMEVTDAEVQAAIDDLRALSLVIESSGGRVMRYAHNAERVLDVAGPAVALLAVLMLRGPQTGAELRMNSERLHRFADVSTVEGYLRELAQRPAGALVAELPRLPGTRETRWAHLLSGPVSASAIAPSDRPAASAKLEERVEALERDVAALQSAIEALLSQRGDSS
jgi:hypothetical protein